MRESCDCDPTCPTMTVGKNLVVRAGPWLNMEGSRDSTFMVSVR